VVDLIYLQVLFFAMDRDGDQKQRNREATGYRRMKVGGGTATEIVSSHLSSFTNISAMLSTMRVFHR
jgi:hypothetical protein